MKHSTARISMLTNRHHKVRLWAFPQSQDQYLLELLIVGLQKQNRNEK